MSASELEVDLFASGFLSERPHPRIRLPYRSHRRDLVADLSQWHGSAATFVLFVVIPPVDPLLVILFGVAFVILLAVRGVVSFRGTRTHRDMTAPFQTTS